jgi:cytochrome c-type biogenesis protein CcmH
MRVAHALLGFMGLVAVLGVALRLNSHATAAPSAKALEATLLAPCCFGGTLDAHDSEIARALRTEIEARVSRGESTAAIEDDLVERYGARMRAMPTQGLFTAVIGAAMAAIALGALGTALLASRWRGHDSAVATLVASPASRDGYDDRLDAELRDQDA